MGKPSKLARLSIDYGRDSLVYKCVFDWPHDCFCQAGTKGIVFVDDGTGSYETSFFEAFPLDLGTFIRGEGENVEAAEKNAWDQYCKFLACPKHEYERGGYTNGAGLCIHCGMFKSNIFEPSTRCRICHAPTTLNQDLDGNYYCEEHQRDKPLEKWFRFDWERAYMENEILRLR